MEVELTPKQKENSRKDAVVLNNLSQIVVLSEGILQSLSNVQASGSNLYRHKFKVHTKNYRKLLVGTLNNYYDVMETGGVGDAFILQMKQDAALHAMIPDLNYEQKKQVAQFMESLINGPAVPETLEEENEELHQEEVIEAEKLEVDDDDDLTDEQRELKAMLEEDGTFPLEDKTEEVVSEDDDEDLTEEQRELKAMLEGAADEVEEEVSQEILASVSAAVSPAEYEEIMAQETAPGRSEKEVINSVIDRIAHRKGVDNELYAFSGTNKTPDEKGNLVFNFKLKM